VFFVAEDSFRIGEYVEIGQLRGTVERISLRSMKVRHHRGALHTIPYGQIPSVTNYSRDWVIVKFELQVPHETDVMRLKKVVKQVSAEINQIPEFAPFILEPLKSQGVDSVDLFGLTVRLKFKAVPGEQFTMRREMLRRLAAALEENGIRLARRSVHVETSGHAADMGVAADIEEDAQDPRRASPPATSPAALGPEDP
jgi:small-conductance mechanosensitive channel